jgi:hypothetical protein
MNPKIIDYKVVNGTWYWAKTRSDKMPSLDEEVARAMEEGWQPIGSPVITMPGRRLARPVISQAMVRYEQS